MIEDVPVVVTFVSRSVFTRLWFFPATLTCGVRAPDRVRACLFRSFFVMIKDHCLLPPRSKHSGWTTVVDAGDLKLEEEKEGGRQVYYA